MQTVREHELRLAVLCWSSAVLGLTHNGCDTSAVISVIHSAGLRQMSSGGKLVGTAIRALRLETAAIRRNSVSKKAASFDTFVSTLVRFWRCSERRSSPSPPPCMSLSELLILPCAYCRVSRLCFYRAERYSRLGLENN